MEQLKLYAFKLFKHEVFDLNLNKVIESHVVKYEKRHAVPKVTKRKVHWLKEGLHKETNNYNDGYHYGIYFIEDRTGNLVGEEWHRDPNDRDASFKDWTEND